MHLNMGAVVVVGAGLSLDARFPLTPGLNTLVWDALDQSPSAEDAVARRLGVPSASGKLLVGDEWSKVSVAWEVIEADPEARLRLQRQFSTLDQERVKLASPAHEALARLIHAGVVEAVVSLNWDTALEAAYRRLYGVEVPADVLFKPHGDATQPEHDWTLPHENGRVPASVRDFVARLRAGHARTLVVIGYSEQDRTIVDELIRPLDATWRTIRVGPNATGAHDVHTPAEDALPMIAEDYARREDASAWHSVVFGGHRDIRAALRGERLDPRDTDACPPLAEVPILVDALLTDRAVVLNGPTGSGKSISAYQALRQLAQRGFEVVRLRDSARGLPPRMWVQGLRSFPHKKVLFIDDAQDMSPDAVRELCEAAEENTRVLVVGIDHVAGGVRTIRQGAGAAVARLAKWIRDEKTAMFPLVRELDDHVGNHADGPEFNRRIDVAAKKDTAWLFFYVLTGGWRRIRRQAVELRDAERADLAWLALSVAQIAGVDAGVSRDELAEYVGVLGKDSEWMGRVLVTLEARRLVIEVDGRLRCPHLQTAYRVLNWMLHPPQWDPPNITRPHVPPIESANTDPTTSPPKRSSAATRVSATVDLSRTDQEADRDAACSLVRYALDSPATPRRGMSWLAGKSTAGDTRHMLEWKKVLGPDRNRMLALRALATPVDGDVAAAATLLADAISWGRDLAPLLTVPDHEARLREWLGTISPENAWALGDLVNSLYNVDMAYAQKVISHTDPARLAGLVPQGGWPQSASTGHALERFTCLGSSGFRTTVAQAMDAEAYADMLRNPDPAFWRTATLIEHVASADFPLALQLLRQAADRLARGFVGDPLVNWNDMHGMVMVLGYGPPFLRGGRRPPKEAGAAIRTFTRALDVVALARILSRPNELWGTYNFDELVSLLSESDPKTLRAVLDRVDMGAFEEALRSALKAPRTALYVALYLHERRPAEVHAMLDRLEPDLEVLDPFLAFMAPDIAVLSLRRALPLDLELDHHHWALAAQVVSRLASVDEQAAREVLQANAAAMGLGLEAKNHSDPWEGLRQFVPVCDRVAPGLMDHVIGALPEGSVAGWDRGLRRPVKYHGNRRPDVEPLVERASRAGGDAAREAAHLHRRFPSLRPSSEFPDARAPGDTMSTNWANQ